MGRGQDEEYTHRETGVDDLRLSTTTSASALRALRSVWFRSYADAALVNRTIDQ